jgi:hypothetical protein
MFLLGDAIHFLQELVGKRDHYLGRHYPTLGSDIALLYLEKILCQSLRVEKAIYNEKVLGKPRA